MNIKHYICGSGCPFAAKYVPNIPEKTIVHVLLVESKDGLILIDSGMSKEDAYHPQKNLGNFTTMMLGMRSETGVSVLEQMTTQGYKASDVRHIIPTHLDFDHVGGLRDFPHASVHVFEKELLRALHVRKYKEKNRYFSNAWAHDPKWVIHKEAKGEKWMGFESVRDIPGLPPELLLIPMPGHSIGHTGIAVYNPTADREWILHAGDAYYDRRELTCPTKNWAYQMMGSLIHHDLLRYRANQEKLTHLLSSNNTIQVLSAHDPSEFPSI